VGLTLGDCWRDFEEVETTGAVRGRCLMVRGAPVLLGECGFFGRDAIVQGTGIEEQSLASRASAVESGRMFKNI